jgi:hypothetical protein
MKMRSRPKAHARAFWFESGRREPESATNRLPFSLAARSLKVANECHRRQPNSNRDTFLAGGRETRGARIKGTLRIKRSLAIALSGTASRLGARQSTQGRRRYPRFDVRAMLAEPPSDDCLVSENIGIKEQQPLGKEAGLSSPSQFALTSARIGFLCSRRRDSSASSHRARYSRIMRSWSIRMRRAVSALTTMAKLSAISTYFLPYLRMPRVTAKVDASPGKEPKQKGKSLRFPPSLARRFKRASVAPQKPMPQIIDHA